MKNKSKKMVTKIKQLLFALLAVFIITSCDKGAKTSTPQEEVSKANKGKKQGEVTTTLGTTATITLTNNGGGSFSVDYGGATDVVWMFFRWGDSLSVSGNVIPTASQSYYLNPVTTFTANGSGSFYQAVVTTGSNTRDANGVLGADWVSNFSNVVQ